MVWNKVEKKVVVKFVKLKCKVVFKKLKMFIKLFIDVDGFLFMCCKKKLE